MAVWAGAFAGLAVTAPFEFVTNKIREGRIDRHARQAFHEAFTDSADNDKIMLGLCGFCEAFGKALFLLADNKIPEIPKLLEATHTYANEKKMEEVSDVEILTVLERFSTTLLNYYLDRGHSTTGEIPASFKIFDERVRSYMLQVGLQPPPREKPQDDKAYFIVPHRKNDSLRHADIWIKQIQESLAKDGELAKGKTVALKGQGGIGKTAMAAEYAYRYRDEYPGGVYWLRMDQGIGSAATGFMDAAPNYGLDFGNWQNLPEPQQVQKVISFFNQGPLKLVIPDNVESDTLPKELNIPDAHLLVTTRRSTLPLPLIGMVLPEEEEALKIFLAYAGMEGKEISEEELAAAIDICRRVDRLPLALEIMGQIARLRHLSTIVERLKEDVVDTEATVGIAGEVTTIRKVLRLADREFENPRAKEGMIAAAYLHPENLDRIIMAGVLGIKEKKADEIFDDLARLAVVEKGKQAYSVHRLTQEAARSMDDGQIIGLEAAGYLDALIEAVSEVGVYLHAYQLIPHLVHLATLAGEKTEEGEFPTVLLVNRWTSYLKNAGQYEQTESLRRICLERVKKSKGKNHPDYAISLNNLANIVRTQGRYVEAERLYRQALSIGERTIGKKHPSYAVRLNNLANVLRAQGRYEEAEKLYRQALEIDKWTRGEINPSSAVRLNNLAGVVEAQGRYEEAEWLFKLALSISNPTIKVEYPEFSNNINNFNSYMLFLKHNREAGDPYRQAFTSVERTTGTEHPFYAVHLSNLASVVESRGRYEEAEGLIRQALEIDERTIGTDHPDYALHLHNLANVVHSQGRYEEAKGLYRQALEISEITLVPNHPQTETIRKNYEILLTEMKQE